MSFNPLSEVRYRYRLGIEHLERAERLFSLNDWVGTVSASQLAVESLAKAVIALFEVPTWSHDPSGQLSSLLEQMPDDIVDSVKKLVAFAREMAPEHGRSSYGEPSAGIVPGDIYKEEHASKALEEARKARETAERVLERFDIGELVGEAQRR
ncbi:MAG: HEPN domain-containing protein [Methanophagales archaeon]|nr:HEPN domain-containing protein [Methanophagales archaeon]